MATAETLINDGLSRLAALQTDMLGFVNDLKTFTQTFNISADIPGGRSFVIAMDHSQVTSAINNAPDRPEDFNITKPPLPGDLSQFLNQFGIRELEGVDVPTFTGPMPLIDIPERPTLDDLPAPPEEPIIANPFIPVSPDVELPDVPSLTDVNVPEAPSIFIPLFDREFPEAPDILTPDEGKFQYEEQDFSHFLLDEVTNVLFTDLQSGEGVNILLLEDEEQVFERLKDREYRSALVSEMEVLDTMAERGFPVPSGASVFLLQSAQKDARGRMSEAQRELSIQRVEMFRRAREFAIQNGISLLQTLIVQHGFKQQRALEVSKFIAQFSIEVADIQIRRYNTLVQAYQAFAQAYESRIRAALSQIEIYRAEVDAAATKQQINRITVELYNAQVNAARTLIDLYVAQMSAAQVETQIEQLKVQLFESRTRAFVSQIQARQSEVDLYQTVVGAEQTKVDIFKTQVQAYESEVRAANVQSNIRVQNIQSDIEKAKLSLQAYTSSVDAFRAELAGEVARVEGLARVYSSDIDKYRSTISGWVSLGQLNQAMIEGFLRASAVDQQLEQNASQIALSGLLEEAKIRLSGIQTGTEVFGRTMAAAQEVMNAVVQVEEPE